MHLSLTVEPEASRFEVLRLPHEPDRIRVLQAWHGWDRTSLAVSDEYHSEDDGQRNDLDRDPDDLQECGMKEVGITRVSDAGI